MSVTLSKIKTGALIAAGAAALVLSGAASADTTYLAQAAKIHCAGVNSCKGTSDCKTAENACKGMNQCKGHGFLSLTKKECGAKGGTVSTS